MTDKDMLIGKIVSWPNMGEENSWQYIGCGRGKVVAILDSSFMLVRRIPRQGDPEPSYMLTLPTTVPNLRFFNSLRRENKWYTWVISPPTPRAVLSLVREE